MKSDFQRYAIYALPDGPLGDYGAAWLGWDARHGTECVHPDLRGLRGAPEELTRTPRKYGFHATIKPPFRLAAGQEAAALAAAIEVLCARLRSVEIPGGLEVASLGRILALRPTLASNALSDLAADIVQTLDDFRAPAPPEELARRRRAGLTSRQEALLVRWGYPYVMEEFRPHFTLTGRVPDAELGATRDALERYFEPVLASPWALESLCLTGQGNDGRFRLIRRFALG
jgi:putative phosphonate metabolism protein